MHFFHLFSKNPIQNGMLLAILFPILHINWKFKANFEQIPVRYERDLPILELH